MTESELDSLYGELCRALSQIGEAGAPLFLARFALLAIGELDDASRVRALLMSARDCGDTAALSAATAAGTPRHVQGSLPAGD